MPFMLAEYPFKANNGQVEEEAYMPSEQGEPGEHLFIHFDFSGRREIAQREQREAQADRDLRADPEYRAVADRLAAGEEHRAREHTRNGNRHFLAATALVAATLAVDLGAAEALHMQQYLAGQDVTEWPQRLFHGTALVGGGILALVQGSKAWAQWGHAASENRLATRHRRTY